MGLVFGSNTTDVQLEQIKH